MYSFNDLVVYEDVSNVRTCTNNKRIFSGLFIYFIKIFVKLHNPPNYNFIGTKYFRYFFCVFQCIFLKFNYLNVFAEYYESGHNFKLTVHIFRLNDQNNRRKQR